MQQGNVQELTKQFDVDDAKTVLIDGAGLTVDLWNNFNVTAGATLCIRDAVLDGMKISQAVQADGAKIWLHKVTLYNCRGNVKLATSLPLREMLCLRESLVCCCCIACMLVIVLLQRGGAVCLKNKAVLDATECRFLTNSAEVQHHFCFSMSWLHVIAAGLGQVDGGAVYAIRSNF